MHSRATQYLQSLESNIEQFQNNTLVLRLVLSIAVFVSHFYAVYGLPEPGIPFGIHSWGWYAVNAFFLISGVLISQSYRNRDFISFAVSRVLRIYPAYIIAIFFTVLAAVAFTEPSHGGKAMLLEVINIVTLNLVPLTLFEGSISGAWANTAIPGALNGSLWTIPFEVMSYIFVIPLFFDRNLKKVIKLLLAVVFVYVMSHSHVISTGIRYDLLRVFGYFIIGIGVYDLVKARKLNANIIIGLIIIYVCEPIIKEFAVNIVLTVATIHLALYWKKFSFMKNDYSYAIYLFAWPVTQIIVSNFDTSVYVELLYAAVLLSLLSYVSWHYVEKPSLRLKRIGLQNWFVFRSTKS
ncbi:acyltransferase family protein [Vibrio neptunius]|uniref:acyltransferase family protein n=1 Tax=Vibrio neptunius TaxID=170651 RepID=UPI0019D1DD3C|nr:acyltransferase [Vibrio neptunius]MBN3573437.1 acyltransferase [Vibrio neptunius]QXX07758.1 acyltransferase [Vibrio neptunius]